MSSAVLTLTRGLPGSGKTTWAKAQTTTQPATVRVNRDEVRAMLLPDWPHGDRGWEQVCTIAQHAQIKALLDAGMHVICDDTNLNDCETATLVYLAMCAEARVRVQDFTSVPIEVCIARDAARPHPVGAQAIRRMWDNYQASIRAGEAR
jgi:predicted kinase